MNWFGQVSYLQASEMFCISIFNFQVVDDLLKSEIVEGTAQRRSVEKNSIQQTIIFQLG